MFKRRRSTASSELLDDLRQRVPQLPEIDEWRVLETLPPLEGVPGHWHPVELLAVGERSGIRPFGAAAYRGDGRLRCLLLGCARSDGTVVEVYHDPGPERWPSPMPLRNLSDWRHLATGMIAHLAECEQVRAAGGDPYADRSFADRSPSFRAFAADGPAPRLHSWLVAEILDLEGRTPRGGRIERWSAVYAYGAIDYRQVAVAVQPSGELTAMLTLEGMPAQHDDLFLGLWFGGQRRNLGTALDVPDRQAFIDAASKFLTPLLAGLEPPSQ